MSLPFYKITCSDCSFEDGDVIEGPSYIYEGLPEHKPVIQCAWCRDCDKIVSICVPFNRQHAQRETFDLDLRANRKKDGFFAKIFRIKIIEMRKQLEIEKANHEALKINKRLKHFETTHYQSRCMNCGGNNVFTYNLPSCGLNKVERMNIGHSCGGQLLISMAGWIDFARDTGFPNIGYNEDGMILYDERKLKFRMMRCLQPH